MVNIGLIGTGYMGRDHCNTIVNKLTDCRLYGVADSNIDSAKETAEKYGARCFESAKDLISCDEIDAVVVVTPGWIHAENVLSALENNKYVFCEKPLSDSAEDCRRIVETEMKKSKRMVQVGFMRRYDKGYTQMKEVIDSKKLGEPLIVHCAHRAPQMYGVWTSKMHVTDCFIHEIDLLHWLINDEYESVMILKPRKSKHSKEEGSQIEEDPQVLVIKTKKGVIAEIEGFVSCRFGYDIQCEVVCDEGIVKLPDPSYPQIRVGGKSETQLEMDWTKRFIDSYPTELQEFVDIVNEKGNIAGPNAWDGYMAAVTADKCIEAQRTPGKFLNVEFQETPGFYKR